LVGAAHWYLNQRSTPLNDVALDGVIRRFVNEPGFDATASLCWLTVSFPSSHLIGYLYSIDDLSGQNTIHTNTPYAATLYFESRETAGSATADSITGEWDEIGFISLDKCIGQSSSPTPSQANMTQWAENVLELTGSEMDKAFIASMINTTVGNIFQYNDLIDQWENTGTLVTSTTDAIHDVDNRTYYKDFINESSEDRMAQLRLTVKSIMNIASLPSGSYDVAMPEMQFFGLPTETINAGVNIATVTYLKAEDSNGQLHDILGRHQRLPYYNDISSYTYFRLYIDLPGYINQSDKTLHFAIQDSNGSMVEQTGISFNNTPSTPYRSVSCAITYKTQAAYYELYFYSATNEKIILSSGYITGGQS
jgi:hypothetical protein